ncbi:collagen alpha-2(I) chain-like isoform X1 [Sparus aurata]|uniref:collagen alpha-2(I) chain-like isoform X1 n=1 Tax=Sparus aurata TaxID=8175 RepID=UPI0011C108EA|nr:collagen alpha-2(I) chain-like isoform X1 [Sparus aurata]
MIRFGVKIYTPMEHRVGRPSLPTRRKSSPSSGRRPLKALVGASMFRGTRGSQKVRMKRSHPGAEQGRACPQERSTPTTVPCPCAPTSRARCPHAGRRNRAARNNDLHLQRDAGAHGEEEVGGAAGDRGPTRTTNCPAGRDGPDKAGEVGAAPETAGACRGAVQPSLHLGSNHPSPGFSLLPHS